jgi:hypothetical protein
MGICADKINLRTLDAFHNILLQSSIIVLILATLAGNAELLQISTDTSECSQQIT